MRSVKFMSTYGEASCATGEQKAPPRLPLRGSASIRRSSKKPPASSAMRGEKRRNDASIIPRASG
jgi:hypothetical protein